MSETSKESGNKETGNNNEDRNVGQHFQRIAGLVIFFILVFLIPLGSRPMICPDESRYAEIPREMLAADNLIVPTLCGTPYYEKTALGYQTTALSFQAFGENLFALRLPNVLAVALTMFFLYFMLFRAVHDSDVSILASILYLTSAFVIGVGVFAVPDSQLTAALSVSIGSFYLARESKRKTTVLFWLVLSGIACGAAFQIKGFLAFVIPAIVLTAFLVWMKDWKRLLLYPWIPIVVAFLVSLPWSLAIHRQEPGFWHYFIVEEHINRFLSETHDKGSQTIFYFLPILLTGILPAGGTAVCAWLGWRSKGFWSRPINRLMICWVLLPFLFFSISSCKTGTYILPCFFPVTALLALGVREAFRIDPEKAGYRMSLFFLWLGAAAFFGGLVTLVLFPLPWHQWFSGIYDLYPDGNKLGYLSTSLSILWGAILFMHRKKIKVAFKIYFLGLAPVLLCVFFVLPIGLFGSHSASYSLKKVLEHVPVYSDDIIFTDGGGTAAYAWTLKRTDFVYINPSKEIKFWYSKNPDRASGPVFETIDPVEIQKILAKSPPKKGILVTDRDLKNFSFIFPRPVEKTYSFQGTTIYRF